MWVCVRVCGCVCVCGGGSDVKDDSGESDGDTQVCEGVCVCVCVCVSDAKDDSGESVSLWRHSGVWV